MDEYLNEVRKVSGEIWNFFKAYVGTKNDNDEKWEECIKVAAALLKRHEKSQAYNYARKYMNVVMEELERVGKIC